MVKGLGLWISSRSGSNDARVYLLEDLQQADHKIEFMSAYSSLNMLRNEFLTLSEFTIAAEALNGSTSAQEEESDISFSANPLEFLATLGAQLIPEERFITSLYRLRKHFLEPNHSESGKKWRPNIVGYPVFIAAAAPI